jgi:hypothetical protein
MGLCAMACRAYCSKADAAWPPLWVALSYLMATCLPIPFLALLVVLPALFVAGMAFFAMVLAGEMDGLHTVAMACERPHWPPLCPIVFPEGAPVVADTHPQSCA